MPFLVYNIKGKIFFHQEGQKRTLLRTITCRTHESAEWNLILYHDAKAMKPALLKDIPRRWNYNTYGQSSAFLNVFNFKECTNVQTNFNRRNIPKQNKARFS